MNEWRMRSAGIRIEKARCREREVDGRRVERVEGEIG